MPTATYRHPTDATRFVCWGLAGSLLIFGVLRLPWLETHLVLPLTRAQGALAVAMFGAPLLPVDVTLACSGTDALALCLGAVLAFPARWSARLAGAAGGVALILILNTLRIGTLGLVVATPWWFDALHVYGWPAILMLAIAGYVFAWMRGVEPLGPGGLAALLAPSPASASSSLTPSVKFIGLTAAFVIAFAAAGPLYLESPFVLALGSLIASAAAAVLGALGGSAHAAANVLSTSRGAFIVTQECIATPLIPVYAAAVCTHARGPRAIAAGLAATLPLFTALAVARLLIVAVPEAIVASPTFLVHAFYQLLLGAAVVCLAARWRHGESAPFYAAAGLAVGILFVILLGPAYTWMVTPPVDLALADPQGAVAFLPAFQAGLYLALWMAALRDSRASHVAAGFAVLAVMQAAAPFVMSATADWPVAGVRAWAVAGPVAIFAVVVTRARPSL